MPAIFKKRSSRKGSTVRLYTTLPLPELRTSQKLREIEDQWI